MKNHYLKNQLIRSWLLLICLWWSSVFSQTPQLNFTLVNDQSGATKNYVARDYIILGNGFKYTATPGQSFIARINTLIEITLPNGNIMQPDGNQRKPNGTIIDPDGTQFIPGKTPSGALDPTKDRIINPDGTTLNISLVVPEAWFKTIPTTTDLNGNYKWKDFSLNNAKLVNYSEPETSTEYAVARASVMYYNFNPAIDLTAGSISKEIKITKSNLAQATVIGVWGTKVEQNNTDRFIFALNGRKNESVVFSKSNIYSSIESGKPVLPYGSEKVKNLLCVANNSTSANKARESSLRIASYYQANMPNTTLWGKPQKANISLGAPFQSSNTNNTSTFNAALNNFEGFKGYAPELLIFSKVLQPIERSIFESYLAIKYGLSMDKSYYSANGKTIWNYKANSTYNNRITGYGTDSILGLNQIMATTSYQEAPYYSDSCDSYLANSYSLSTPNRLLVIANQSETKLDNGEYLLIGDNNLAIAATDLSFSNYIAMQRKWLVNINSDRLINNTIELAYSNTLASDFDSHKNNTYIIIMRNSVQKEIKATSVDVSRSKIIFSNVDLKKGDEFTFGYLKGSQNSKRKEETVGDSDPLENNIRVYQNDNTNRKNITVSVQTALPSPAYITAYDMAGRKVYSENMPVGSDTRYANFSINIPGIYVIKVITNTYNYTTKVIVNQ